VGEKFPAKTKPAIAKNALAVIFLALKGLMQANEILHKSKKISTLMSYSIGTIIAGTSSLAICHVRTR